MAIFSANLGSGIGDKAPVVPYQDCFAKTDVSGNPGMSVLTHCLIVGHVAKALLQYLPPVIRSRLGANPVLAAALHDVGKVSPGFQLKYFRDALAAKKHPLAARHGGFDESHAAVSELTLCDVFGTGNSIPPVAQVAGVHHGKRRENSQKTDLDYVAEGTEWPKERRKLIHALEEEFGRLGEQPEDGLSAMLLAGLTCVADWIGSDEDFFDPGCPDRDINLKQLADDAVSKCGWRKIDLRHNLTFEDVFGFPPHPMQAGLVAQTASSGVYVLEAPTGMGKTEAALYAAYRLMEKEKANGIYFGLPTRLTSDQIHLRVEQFLRNICVDERSAKLAHGTAWLSRFKMEHGPVDRKRDDNADSWFNPLKRALLYPFGVGTIDQALLGILNVRHFFLRLFGLAGKVVILDEVHTYDMFTGTHLDRLVQLLRNLDCTVLILSATLTAERRADLLGLNTASQIQGYPLITSTDGRSCAFASPPATRIKVQVRPWSDKEVAKAAATAATESASVLCIANTVAQAQAWHCAVKAQMTQDAFDIGLLHSKFIGVHRSEKEAYWMERLGKHGNRSKGCVLVATQVVEQSVDLDADFMITELAPTDMLIQRLGRLWRHPRNVRPVEQPSIVIAAQDLPPEGDVDQLRQTLGIANAYVYSPYVLCRSFEVWKNYDSSVVTLPDQVRELLNKTYEIRDQEPAAWIMLRKKQEEENTKLWRRANAVQAGGKGIPLGHDDERAATRYNDRPMREIVLVRQIDDRGTEATLDLLSGTRIDVSAFRRNVYARAELLQNMLSVPAYLFPSVAQAPAWLKNNMSDKAILVICDSGGRLLLNGAATGLAYDQNKGLVRLIGEKLMERPQSIALDDQFETYSDYDTEECSYELGEW